MPNSEPKYTAFNYCVCFIDLLGQRNAAQGQGLLPNINSEAEDEAFRKSYRRTLAASSSFNEM